MDTGSRATFVVLAAISALAGCGGGSGGGTAVRATATAANHPPVATTPTAVRVSQASPSGMVACPSGGSVIYTNAEVEPHLVIDPTNPNHLVAAWQQDPPLRRRRAGLVTAVSVDGGMSWSGHRGAPFSQCAGGNFARVSDPWLSIAGNTVMQAGIAFTGAHCPPAHAVPCWRVARRRRLLLERQRGPGGRRRVAALHDKESVTIDPRIRAMSTSCGTASIATIGARRCCRVPPTAASAGAPRGHLRSGCRAADHWQRRGGRIERGHRQFLH